MNSIGLSLRSYAAGMVAAGAGPDKFSALCEDIVLDEMMAFQLADITADPCDMGTWLDTASAWRTFGRRGCALPDIDFKPNVIAAAEFLGNFVEELSLT